MARIPCAVFWDIQNIAVPKGQSADSIVSLIRSSIINLYNLREIYFYCVCDVTRLPAHLGNRLTNADVNIIQAYDYTKDSADIKILDLMRKFVESYGKDCSIILLSGDGDYAVTLEGLKKVFNVNIYLITLAKSFSPRLQATANFTFILTPNGQINPIRSIAQPKFLVSFSRYPVTRAIKEIICELTKLTRPFGSIYRSAISYENEVIIGFPSFELARRAVEHLNSYRFHGTFLKAELLVNPISEIMFKMQSACLSPPFKPNRSKSLNRLDSKNKQSNNWNSKSNSNVPIGRLKETPDFIPIVSTSRFLSDSTVSSTSTNPFRLTSNKQINRASKENKKTKEPETRWVSLYSEKTDTKSPILIDLTGGGCLNTRPNLPSSSTTPESIPVVDLTED